MSEAGTESPQNSLLSPPLHFSSRGLKSAHDNFRAQLFLSLNQLWWAAIRKSINLADRGLFLENDDHDGATKV